MINFCLSILVALTTFTSSSNELPQSQTQKVGIYKTYNDFKKGKLKTYESYVSTTFVLNKYKATFKDKNGEKVVYKLWKEDIWGYTGNDGRIYRVGRYNVPYIWVTKGKINFYTNIGTSFEDEDEKFTFSGLPPQISFGDNGDMVDLSRKSLKKKISNDKKELAYLKDKKRGFQELYDFILEYNERHPQK